MRALLQAIFFLTLSLGFISHAEAANRYVRQGASGNGSGSDWTNAYTALPGSLTRGDTYYIADGSYGGYTFDDAASGTTPITIKKCTASDHGTETGYSAGYCDGQAVFSGLTFKRPYYVFDGAKRNESNWQETLVYGFKISEIYASTDDGANAPNITIRYVDIGGPNGEICTGNTPGSGIYAVYGSMHNWTISRSHIHNVEISIRTVDVNNWTIEHTHLGPSWAKESISNNEASGWIIRHNKFIDNLIYPPSACQHGGDGATADTWTRVNNGSNDNWSIYGNVFGDSGTYNNILRTNAVVLGNYWSGPSDGVSGWKVYNNVFYNIQGGKNLVKLGNGSGNVVANNLWYKSRQAGQDIGIVTNGAVYTSWCNSTPYSLCPSSPGTWLQGSDNPFVNVAGFNFNLKSSISGASPINTGTALGSGFDPVDGNGNIRGADGTWDIGAYEYTSGTPLDPDTTPPTSPTGLSASAPSQSSISVSWTASTDPIVAGQTTSGVSNYIVERCQSSGCSNFTQVGTPTASPFVDSGLTPNTFYNYHVRAIDGSGNLSGWSNVVGATTQTPDTTPPSTPSSLSASASSSSQIDLTWTASTDNIAVTSYTVERCSGTSCANFTQVGTPTSNSYSDTGLSATTTYRYRVRAVDGAGNNSSYSNIASATTPAAPPVSQNMMLGLNLNEGTGTTTADVSGHNHTGTLQNGTAWNTTGKYNNSLTFDGVDDVVDIGNPSTLNLTSSFTLSAWVYPTNLSGDRDIITKVSSSSDYHLQTTNTGQVQVGFSNGGSWYSATTTTSLPLNTWTFVAGVFDDTNNTLTVFINGAQSAQGTNITATPQSSTNPVHVGMGWGGQNWNGRIDDVRIYNIALTQTEIQTDMNTPLTAGGGSGSVSCNTVTPTNFSQAAYNSYGAPYDLFASNASLVDAKCTSGDTHTIETTIGKTGDTTRIAYTTGYYYDPGISDWAPFTGTCTGTLNGEWCAGPTTATITDPDISTASATNPAYIVGFTCSVQGGSWKCGCRDTTCANFSWQVQGAGR